MLVKKSKNKHPKPSTSNRGRTYEKRTERDSMGEVTIPATALYGAQTQRAIENFALSDLTMPREFIHALGQIKSACAQVNGQLGLLPADKAQAIKEAADAVSSGAHDIDFPVDVFQTGSGTSTNMNANEVIAHLASQSLKKPVHANDDVNMSQSSNDVIPSCIHVSAVFAIKRKLLPALVELVQVIDKKGQTLSDVIKTGRTHLMDAMPLTFEQEMSGWAAQLTLNIDRINDGLSRLQALGIGATAVGTGVNAPKNFASNVVAKLSEETGVAFKVKENHFEALSCQDTAVEMSGHLKTLAVSMMKISNDLRWYNSGPIAGLAEVSLPALQPGSSIMPGKINPVIPEAVTMVCAQVIGNDATITVAGQSGNFQLNVMLPVIAYNLLQSIDLLANAATSLARKTITDFTVNQERISELLQRNPVIATALNRELGYDKTSQLVKVAYEQKRTIIDVAKEMTDLDESRLKELLSPKNLI